MDDEALSPAAARSLARWHAMVDAGDLSGLDDLVHPDAVFSSPVAHTPYRSREAVVLALRGALSVFSDFTYHRSFVAAGGRDVVLEFRARVGDRDVHGTDMIAFDDDGRIVTFEVMVRPASGLQALGAAMAARVGEQLKSYA
jgi:ketosteroid isomerase-like protein